MAVPADALISRASWPGSSGGRRGEGGPTVGDHGHAPGEVGRAQAAAPRRRRSAGRGLADALFSPSPRPRPGYASPRRVPPGDAVAVYDLGGGTFDAAVMRRRADGGFELLRQPEGIEQLGGVDFDDAIFEPRRDALGDALDARPRRRRVDTAVARLRRECTAAKEALSADTEVMIPVLLPGLHTLVRLGRAEFEEMIRPAVAETVGPLRRAIVRAGGPADLDAVLLVGGSSRIRWSPSWSPPSSAAPSSVGTDPKAVVAAGAALAARGVRAPEVGRSRGRRRVVRRRPRGPLILVARRTSSPRPTPEPRRREHRWPARWSGSAPPSPSRRRP